ncbi:MAG TPA: hypothetical protein O0X42_00035 [Methanocorpusculum sp.]|nr:hypothetical protein [Methanocorpusculum sp.]
MALIEIQMNRLGINSIELNSREAEVSAGTALHIKITNYGASTHVTLKTDGSAYTMFTYENIYLEAESEVIVPIRPDAETGSFSMHIISGYGLRDEEIIIKVIKPEPLPVREIPLDTQISSWDKKKTKSNPKAGRVLVCAILPIIALVLILLWVFLFPALSPIMIVSVVYVLMLAGIALVWLSAR